MNEKSIWSTTDSLLIVLNCDNDDQLRGYKKALDKAFNKEVDENFISMAPQAVAEEEVEEGLDANQKRVGQLGPTEKVKNNNIGKLVGANESTEIPEELARIMEMARFKR